MWRCTLLVSLVLLSACAPADWDAEFAAVNQQYYRGELEPALAQARANSARSSGPHAIRFALLAERIEISRQNSDQALAALDALAAQTAPYPQLEATRQLFRGVALFYGRNLDLCRAALDAAGPILASEYSPAGAEYRLWRGNLALRDQAGDEAAQEFRQALTIAEAIDNRYFRSAAEGALGRMSAQAARYDEAAGHYRVCLNDAEAIGAQNLVALTEGNLGVLYRRLGQYGRAAEAFQNAFELHTRLGNRRDAARWQGNLGATFDDADNHDAARDAYLLALAAARDLGMDDSVIKWLNNLAANSLQAGDLDSAKTYLAEAQSHLRASPEPEPRGQAIATMLEGQILEKDGSPAGAAPLYREVFASNASDPESRLRAAGHLIRALGQIGRQGEAAAVFTQATAQLDSFRASLNDVESQISYVDSLPRLYDSYIRLLMDEGKTREALAVVESARAQVLSERLEQAGGHIRTDWLAALQSAARREHRAFLTYWTSPGRSFGWIVTGDGIESRVLPGEEDIAREVSRFRQAVERDHLDPLRVRHPAGEFLYKEVLEPLIGSLPRGARVTVAPHGALHALNFEMLRVPGAEPHYWIEQASVAIAPSLQVLLKPHHSRGAGTGALLVGNPLTAGESYAPLPFTAQELRGIAATLNQGGTKQLTEGNATPAAVLDAAPPARLIHFAAHAEANSVSPLESAVILSPDAGRFKLYARDWLDTKLLADLVTISSCDSAGARTYKGEGLVGFAWVFLQAGAQNVVAGLWEVNDAATAELMTGFYAAMARGETPAEALRTAKLAMLAQSESRLRLPYYWAPFQVYTTGL